MDRELVVADDHVASLVSVVRWVPRCGTGDLDSCYLSIAGHIAVRSGRRLLCRDIGSGAFGNRCFHAVDARLASLAPQTGPRPSGYRSKSRWRHCTSQLGPSSCFSGAAGGLICRFLAWCHEHPKKIRKENLISLVHCVCIHFRRVKKTIPYQCLNVIL